jgi:hypothetical protein
VVLVFAVFAVFAVCEVFLHNIFRGDPVVVYLLLGLLLLPVWYPLAPESVVVVVLVLGLGFVTVFPMRA